MQPGFWGRITISLRSVAKHPQGEPKAWGICAPTPKTPGPEFVSVSVPRPVRAEPVEAFFLIRSPRSLPSPDAALSPRRATHLFLLRQNKVSQKKATLLSASLRYGQPAVLSPAGVELKLASLKQSLALFRLALRSSAQTEGFSGVGFGFGFGIRPV